ncbi:hypothetical protein ACSTS3_03280 [Aquimarina muelleri]|uniref:hypothetical protein n=1 Tax=Aquimarina muelleri TaxID=279356 RepID=UPI003F686BE8
MKAKVKFHLIASIFNVLLFFLATFLNYKINMLWDEKFGIRASDVLTMVQNFSFFLFFWLFTFWIYLIKDYKKHWIYFLILPLVLVVSKTTYDYIIYHNQDGLHFISFLHFLKLSILDTLLLISISSIGIHFSQMFIGKKVLSSSYRS